MTASGFISSVNKHVMKECVHLSTIIRISYSIIECIYVPKHLVNTEHSHHGIVIYTYPNKFTFI